MLPFGLPITSTTFQRVVLSIFADVVHDSVEMHMDDLTIYGKSYNEGKANLEKVLQ